MTTVSSGSVLDISAGQTSNGVIVLSHGLLNVSSGGSSFFTSVYYGGQENLGGFAVGTLLSGGFQNVDGVASGTIIIG